MALKTTIPENQARLKSKVVHPDFGTVVITRFWPDIDATVSNALLDTLNVTTGIVGPYADGVQYSGTYYPANLARADAQSDRSVTISQTIVLAGDSSAAPFYSEVENPGTRFEKRTRYWVGIPSALRTTAYAFFKETATGNLAQGGARGPGLSTGATTADPDLSSTFIVTSVRERQNDDSTWTFVQVIEYAQAWPGTIATPHVTEYPRSGLAVDLVKDWTWYSYRTASGGIATAIAAIQANATYGKVTGYYTSVTVNDRRNGIFDLLVRRTADETTFTLPGWTIGDLADVDYTRLETRQAKTGIWYYRYVTYTVSYHSSATYVAALTWLAGENTETGVPNGPQAGVFHIDKYRHLAIAVTSNSDTAIWQESTFESGTAP